MIDGYYFKHKFYEMLKKVTLQRSPAEVKKIDLMLNTTKQKKAKLFQVVFAKQSSYFFNKGQNHYSFSFV